jgi:hypothetical protein
MSGDNFLTVRSNYIGQCLVPKSFTTSNYFKQQQNIISFVNVDANFGEVIFQDRDLGVGSFFKTQKPCYMNLVDFQLTFPDGTPVELPDNANWQLRCAFYYDEAL